MNCQYRSMYYEQFNVASLGIYGDPISTKTLQGLWKKAIQGGTCLMALKINDGELPVLIGANMTPISNKKESSDQVMF